MDAQHLRRRRGQTAAEFALTLPILLILLFGIIEFGRIFQAWVTLQNSARAAARFASTGQPFVGDDDGGYDLSLLVPCVAGDARGSIGSRAIGGQKGSIQIYTGGVESLFATMYDGENCEVGDSHSTGTALEHYYRRTDLARLLLIYREARRGAAGLALEPDPYLPFNEASIRQFVYDQFTRPRPRGETRQWFNVMLCSSRPMFDGPNVPGGASTSFDITNPNSENRFQTILEASGAGSSPDAPMCRLNEHRTGAGGGLINDGAPWIDAGGPGDRISLVITFNHPLITPLGLADFIPLQARRTAVNESFRVANAVTVLQGGGQIGPVLPTLPPTATPTNTPSPTITPTTPPPVAPTSTGTPTLAPGFTCNALTASNLSFFQNRIYIDFRNGNVQSTTLMSASINWRTVADYPGMYMGSMSLNTEVFWQGLDTSPPTVTNADAGFIADASRVIVGGETGTFEGYYLNGPGQLSQYLTIYDFAGSSFQFLNPTGGANCVVTLALPQPTPSPTRDPNVPPVNSTATGTPDCASSLLRLEFVSWDSFGVVKLQVVNNRTVVAPFTNFSINWANIMTRAGLAPGVLTLRQVTVGGSSPADPLTYKLWEAAAGQDTASPTVGRSEGSWRGNYTFQPRSVTAIYLDFDGTSTNLQAAFGAQLSDFNGTTFEIGCGTPGAGTNGTSGSSTGSGQIQINGGSLPTSPPTNTTGPTNTPFPTFTPSRTPTVGPATMTFTPRPTVPTSTTRPPTNTAPPPTSTTRPVDDDGPGG